MASDGINEEDERIAMLHDMEDEGMFVGGATGGASAAAGVAVGAGTGDADGGGGGGEAREEVLIDFDGNGDEAAAAPHGRPMLSPYYWGLHPLYWAHVRLFVGHIHRLQSMPLWPDTHFFGPHPLRSAMIAGTVVAIAERAKTVNYTVDDGTGVIECLQFRTQIDGSTKFHSPLLARLGNAVRVQGRLRKPQRDWQPHSCRELTIEALDVVTDAHVFDHWLDVIELVEAVYSKPLHELVPDIPQYYLDTGSTADEEQAISALKEAIQQVIRQCHPYETVAEGSAVPELSGFRLPTAFDVKDVLACEWLQRQVPSSVASHRLPALVRDILSNLESRGIVFQPIVDKWVLVSSKRILEPVVCRIMRDSSARPPSPSEELVGTSVKRGASPIGFTAKDLEPLVKQDRRCANVDSGAIVRVLYELENQGLVYQCAKGVFTWAT